MRNVIVFSFNRKFNQRAGKTWNSRMKTNKILFGKIKGRKYLEGLRTDGIKVLKLIAQAYSNML